MAVVPSDASSLLVPVQLDAWVVNPNNQQALVQLVPNYTNLAYFTSPEQSPFEESAPVKQIGVNLHWSLPDALTHALQQEPTATTPAKSLFPYVPNRWLVVRFNAVSSPAQWQATLWVINSDQLGGSVGSTNSLATGDKTLTLTSGSLLAIPAGTTLDVTPDNQPVVQVTVAAAVREGQTTISIEPAPGGYTSGSGAAVSFGTSNYLSLDPDKVTQLETDTGFTTTPQVYPASLGVSYSISAWEAHSKNNDSAADQPFLTAVGVGNVSFAAHQPLVNNVFAFCDGTLDLTQNPHTPSYYTYLVAGWYAQTSSDPLASVGTYPTSPYLQALWPAQDGQTSQQQWSSQTEQERFGTILSSFNWSVGKDLLTDAPQAMLCHGLVAGVPWPYAVDGVEQQQNPTIPDSSSVQLALANNAPEALAALIRNAPVSDPEKTTDPGVLAALVQSAMNNLLGDYDQPGGQALVDLKTERAAFGRHPGGLLWALVPATQPSAAAPPSRALAAGPEAQLATLLANLNTTQQAYDEDVRLLESLQASLYETWLKAGIGDSYTVSGVDTPAGFTDELLSYIKASLLAFEQTGTPSLSSQVWAQYCKVAQYHAAGPPLPPSLDPAAVQTWAATAWAPLSLPVLNLQLKPSAQPSFWHPTDPTLMLLGLNRAQKFGEDGRYTDDGSLTCRLATLNQVVTGIQLSSQQALTVDQLQRGGLAGWAYAANGTIPDITNLAAEALFADVNNSAMLAAASGGIGSAAIAAAIGTLMSPPAPASAAPPPTWIGQPPVPFAFAAWQQPWIPLYLEWELNYYPTGDGASSAGTWQENLLQHWRFDGQQYVWQGSGFAAANVLQYSGRTVLTPHAPLLFYDKVKAFLKTYNPPDQPLDVAGLEALLATVSTWDVVSQSLSGLTGQLATLLEQETFLPPPAGSEQVSCPANGTNPPTLTALIGQQYHRMPLVATQGSPVPDFLPVRAGFLQLTQLRVVDSFGQVLPLSGQLNVAGGVLPGQSLMPSSPKLLPQNAVQLPPRLVQNARLNLDLLSVAGAPDAAVPAQLGVVCGWLLPNHLNGGLAVYDASGLPLGDLLPGAEPTAGGIWQPSPGSTQPASPAQIANPTLRQVVVSLYNQPATTFSDAVQAIDETLWLVDPLGGRQDQSLSVLIGRPLAVVQLSLALTAAGPLNYSQTWADTAQPTGPNGAYQAVYNTGDVREVSFPVSLGSLDLRNDGLVGYFLADFNNLYTLHGGTAGTYLQPTVTPPLAGSPSMYSGNINLSLNGDPVVATLLLDPRGSVHAYTGILPVASVALDPHLAEQFLSKLQLTFQTGPLVLDAGTIRTPLPAEQQGAWQWLQQQAATGQTAATWQQSNLVAADATARMPAATPALHEGWLQFTLPDTTF